MWERSLLPHNVLADKECDATGVLFVFKSRVHKNLSFDEQSTSGAFLPLALYSRHLLKFNT